MILAHGTQRRGCRVAIPIVSRHPEVKQSAQGHAERPEKLGRDPRLPHSQSPALTSRHAAMVLDVLLPPTGV